MHHLKIKGNLTEKLFKNMTGDQRPATSPSVYGRDSRARGVVHLSELKSIIDELDAESDNQSMGSLPTSYKSYGHEMFG